MVTALVTSAPPGIRLPAFAAPNRVAQVPLLVGVLQFVPEMTVPATFVMVTVAFENTFAGLVVVAVKVARVEPMTVVSRPSKISVRSSFFFVSTVSRERRDSSAGPTGGRIILWLSEPQRRQILKACDLARNTAPTTRASQRPAACTVRTVHHGC